METIMKIKDDIHAIHHTFYTKITDKSQHLKKILQFCEIQILVSSKYVL